MTKGYLGTDERVKEDILTFVEEKFERRLSEEISKVNEKISGVNERITTEISEVKEQIAETKAELLKWMFIFWAGQIGVMTGLFFTFFKR